MVADRLSYANVVATIALFVALGGASYAAVQINGKQIRNRSIPGRKLKVGAITSKDQNRSAVVPRAVLSDKTADVLVPGSGRPPHAGKLSAAADVPCSTSLVKLSVGESCVMFTKSPFTFTASCNDLGGGSYQIAISATSTESGWYSTDTTPPSS